MNSITVWSIIALVNGVAAVVATYHYVRLRQRVIRFMDANECLYAANTLAIAVIQNVLDASLDDLDPADGANLNVAMSALDNALKLVALATPRS